MPKNTALPPDHQEECKQECKPVNAQRKPTALPKEVTDTITRILTMKPLYVKPGTTPEELREMSLIHQQSCFEEYIEKLLTQAHQDTAQAVQKLFKSVRAGGSGQTIENSMGIERQKIYVRAYNKAIQDVLDQLAPSEQRSEEHGK